MRWALQAKTAKTKATKPPLDPATLVAIGMLRSAFRTARLTKSSLAFDGITVVQVPADEWCEPILDAWRYHVRTGQSPYMPDNGGWYSDEGWAAYARRTGASSSRERADNELLKALSRGCSIIGISASPEAQLPSDLMDAADQRVAVPRPTSSVVTEAVRQICGARPLMRLHAEDAARLTPRLLRLGIRRGQSPDAYVERLAKMLAAAKAHTPAASPREEPTLDRLYGMDEAVCWGKSLALSLREYVAGRIPWSGVDSGVLLSGPPGCGKTLFARALAASCGVPLLPAGYAAWLGAKDGHQGTMLRAMKETFVEARQRAPVILFLDELDSFPNRGSVSAEHTSWYTPVVNALLAEIDGVVGREGVVLVAACNHPDRLDPALVRSGRLERHLRIRRPDLDALPRILREHLGSDLDGQDLQTAALLALGSNGADCERYVRGARRRAREAGRRVVLDDLTAEICSEDGDYSGEDLRIAAVHEAGHAVATLLLGLGPVKGVVLRRSGSAGGLVALDSRKRLYPTEGELKQYLVLYLAGRAAEELILGHASAAAGGGSESDLARATILAATQISALGLDTVTGLLWAGIPEQRELAERMARNNVLSNRIRAIVADAYAGALHLLRTELAAVERVARRLVEKRALTNRELQALVSCSGYEDEEA